MKEPDDDPPPRDEPSLDALRDSGWEPESVESPHRFTGMPDPCESPLYALIVERLTPRQVEIFTVVFESSSRGRAAQILGTSPENVRVQMANIRQRISDVVRMGSTGLIYGPPPK